MNVRISFQNSVKGNLKVSIVSSTFSSKTEVENSLLAAYFFVLFSKDTFFDYFFLLCLTLRDCPLCGIDRLRQYILRDRVVLLILGGTCGE